jgi:hypothetical protein
MIAKQLGEEKVLKAERTAWYRKDHVTFSDMLMAVRMGIWRENLISRKAKISPSGENTSQEMEEWSEAIVKRVLQAA